MSAQSPLRRAAYGPNSPAIGTRGARTRSRLLDAALVVFERQGYPRTRIEDVAVEAGVSRATLYQYFRGKDELFRELATEAGRAMTAATREIDGLGPTDEDWVALRGWLATVRDVFDRYSTLFVQWQQATGADGLLGELGNDFMRGYPRMLAVRLAEAGVRDLEPVDAAVAVLAMVERFHFYRHTRGLDLDEDVLLDALATVVQEALFGSAAAS